MSRYLHASLAVSSTSSDTARLGLDLSLIPQYNVPLLINDRIDVYLAVRCAGIHIGQSDMPLAQARALAGDDAVIGISVGNIDEAQAAIAGHADYVGVGAVWPTGSKDVTKKVKLGPDGVGRVLDVLAESKTPAVAIGE